ncbi:hypothetical protein [Photobacterium ganghwense]|uniref:Uncharacterized protein n=1 Tax=Photobacterium ganghwense TaxID=320778 RepID=A0A0J1K789_9GAMM|nr:hypothetical protein [Photobacterium ganghwense]KLV10202.1 hypothetical protein ABT57_06395 [Photobacterium ganghwense]PSU09923.1 hypothetical protein C9I92_10510 [Photobacterium ganghwense]QSV17172.1 hypothetical protein FH974_19735 [Photobacterium ganghwense]
MILTKKQKQIIHTILIVEEVRGIADLDSVLESLPYKTSKESFQFSLRALIEKRLLTKGELRKRSEGGQNRRTLLLTTLGRAFAKQIARVGMS